MMKRETLEEVGIIGGLVGIQVINAGTSELLSYLMSLGLDALLIVIFCNLASSLLISPFAFLLERKLWPTRLSFKLKIKLVVVGVAGVTLFQWLFLEGMKLTSASMATAMPNLCPAFIFVIAWSLGMEKVKLSCMYTRVKMGGTVLCVMGAFIMSFMHSTTAILSTVKTMPIVTDNVVLDKDKILGCLYLLIAVCCLASSVVLQASILVEFPAPFSMLSIVFLIGGISTIALQYVLNGSMEMGSASVISLGHLVGLAIVMGLVSGGGLSFNAWVIKKKGPVVVSLFSPISTVACVVFSALSKGGESFNFGSFAGMTLMFGGLYFVLWAKGKEDCVVEVEEKDVEESVLRTEFDLQKPLLH